MTNQQDFPNELPIIIEEVEMSIYQFNIYNGLRLMEKEESSYFGDSSNLSRFSLDNKKNKSTYRIKTRQVSNFSFPKNIILHI